MNEWNGLGFVGKDPGVVHPTHWIPLPKLPRETEITLETK